MLAKKITTIALVLNVLFFSATINAQDLKYKDFDFTKEPPVVKLSDTEKKESAVILEEKRGMQYAYNEKGELGFYYFRFKSIVLLEDKAIESFNKIYLPITDQKYILSLKARSISPAGKIKVFGKEDIKEIEEDGNKFAIFALDGLEKNSIIEYYYLVQYGLRYWGTESVQGKNYIRNEKVEIISPKNLLFRAKGYNGFAEFTDTVDGDNNVLRAEQKDIPVLYSETFSQDEANLMRVEYKLDYNTYNSIGKVFNFAKAGQHYYQMMHRDHEDAKKDIASFAKKMKIESLSIDDKIMAIENNIKTNFQILDESDADEIAKIIKNKYGTQIGIDRLYAALFDYFDIKYEILLTCSRYEKKFDSEFDSWTYLENQSYYFPHSKGYVATNNITMRYPMIQHSMRGNKGLFIKEIVLGDLKSGVNSIKYIEPTPCDYSYDNMDFTITFKPDMAAAIIDYKRSMNGYSAIGIRPAYFYSKEDDRKKIINQIIKENSDESKLENIKVSNFDINTKEVNEPFILQCNYINPALIEAAGDNYLVKVGETIGQQSELYDEKPRLTAVENDFNRTYLRKIRVIVPEGYTISGMEKLKINIVMPPTEGNKGYGFISDYKLEGNTLTIDVNEYYDILSLPVSEYNNFTKVVNAAADFNKISLLLKKK